jgi:type VI secretion system protein ImpL
MMSLRRIFGLMLLFLFFEAIVAVVTTIFLPQVNVLLACFSMTGLAIATLAIFWILARLIARRPAKQVAPAKIVVPAGPRASSSEDGFTLEFSALVAEANRRLQALTAIDPKRVAPTVATSPLYLVLGPEGSGKTTAIVNSGIEPRLLAGEAQREGQVVPTATANLWYAEGTVFVEIAGRLLMQEPVRWEKALQILMEQPRLPWWKRLLCPEPARASNLRGVLLVCETDLIQQSRDVRRMGVVARTFNERLQSVQALMRVDVPAYVILTKCDSIANFQEFFSRLTDAEARRILGVTLPQARNSSPYADTYADVEGSRWSKLFNRLYESVADKRMPLIAREDSPEKRARAYEFPRELKKLRGELVQFLLDVFRPSNLYPPCRFRGFYFSAKRLVPRAHSQAATDHSLLLETSTFRRPMGATMIFSANGPVALEHNTFSNGLGEKSAEKWAFLTDLFQQIILVDPAARAGAPRPRPLDSRYLNVSLAAAGTAFLLLSIIWGFSWQQNHRLLNEVQAAIRITDVIPSQNPAEVVRQLDNLRPLVVRLHSYDRGGAELSYHWGLYAGNRATADLDRVYYARFRQSILDPTLSAITGHFMQLQGNGSADQDLVYRQLKSYRMMTSGDCPADESLVASTMLPVWSEAIAPDPEAQALADAQIRLYASELKIADPFGRRIPENKEAETKAVLFLQDLTGPEKILQALLNQVQQEPAERLSAYASNYSQVLSGPDQVDGPFTRAGWNGIEERIRDHKLISSGEPCVVGAAGSGWKSDSAMDVRVQRLYSDAYVLSWKQFLETHHVIPFVNAIDANQKLRILADNNRSPLLALVYITSANTNIAVPTSLRDRVSTVAAGAGNKVIDVFHRISGGEKNPSPTTVESPAESDLNVSAAFDPVHVMVEPGARDKWLNERNQPYMKALGDLGDALLALPPQVHTEVPLETQQLQQAKTAITAADAALHSLAGNFPNGSKSIDVDLENLLREPIDNARRIVAAVPVLKAPALPEVKAAEPKPAPIPPPPGIDPLVKAAIVQINASAVSLCSVQASLQHKFPFDASSSTDVSLDELNALLQPGAGAYPSFSNLPDVSKAYNHAGRIWAQKPEFPATFSQLFVNTLNGFGEAEDAFYGATGDTAHIDLTITVDGTGKLPFQLEVDGHVLKHMPGKPTPPLHLVWPPITNAPARLVTKNGSKKNGMQTGEWTGPWALFHLLQSADDQSGNVFTFRTVQFGHSLNPLTNGKGAPGTIQIRVDSPAGNLFARGYFSKLRCTETWALRQQNPGN